MLRHLRVVAAFLLLGGAMVSGQQAPQTPTFRVSVDNVEVDVLVTDAQGNYVRDLKKEDFQIFEDGKPQPLSNFVPIVIPVERGQQPLFTSRTVEPDVQTNERPFNGRVYVMVLDSAHTLPQNTNLMRNAAKKFINEKLGSNDLMAIVTARGAAGGPEDGQEFTNNRRLLTAVVEKFRGTQPRSAVINKIEDLQNNAPIRAALGPSAPPPVDIDAKEREFNARAVLEELTAVCDWFSVVHGRKKSILFFSEGINYDIHDVFANGGNNSAAQIQERVQDLVRAATKANASIYSIDPRGLMGLSDASIDLQSVDPADPGGAGLDQRGLQNEDRLARESLQTFSGETGGFAVVNTNRLANAFDRIVDENSSYYVLAYVPPNPKRDGKYHNINVRVNRPGVTVRFRKGYANPTGKPPAPTSGTLPPDLVEALRSPVPVSGLGMKVFAAPFKGTAPNASVLMGLELRGRDLTTAANGTVDIAYSAVDARGRSKASSRDTLTLNLRPETKEKVQKDGIRFLNRLELPPGRYQLRIAVHDAGNGASGSILYDLEVPDFSKERIAMSGLVLTSAAASIMPTARPDNELRMVLPGPPAAIRTFAQTDQIALFADVYDNDVTPVHKVDITTTLTADAGRVVFKNEEERSTADLGGKPGGFGIGTTLSLADFDPGLYVLRIEARSRLGDNVMASREVQINITAPEGQAK